MLDIKLPAAEKKRIRELQADIDKVDVVLLAFSEAGIPVPGLILELEKVKKMKKVLLETF